MGLCNMSATDKILREDVGIISSELLEIITLLLVQAKRDDRQGWGGICGTHLGNQTRPPAKWRWDGDKNYVKLLQPLIVRDFI